MVRGSAFALPRFGSLLKKLLVALAFGFVVYSVVLLSLDSSTSAQTDYAPVEPANLVSNAIDDTKKVEKVLIDTKSNSTTSEEEAISVLQERAKYHQNGSVKFAAESSCPSLEDNVKLVGHVAQGSLLIGDLQEDEVFAAHPWIQPGGHWKPSECVATKKVAIIIPYRDRYTHLVRLLDFLIPILRRQLLDFRFIVTEQVGDDLFNKGRIMNAAFELAEKLGMDCVIFHDVDMFPQDDRTPYDCPENPRHTGAFVSNLGYQLWYNELVGGVLALNMDDYKAVNGYSNLYWAWGGEDDDMGKRLLSLNMTIERPNQEFARYSMLKHGKRKRTAPKLIYKLLESASTRWLTDGLTDTQWKISKMVIKPLYYHLLVDVGEPPAEWRSGDSKG